MQLRPDIPELRANLGLMLYQAGDYAEAIESFHAALERKPSLYVPHLFLGLAYLRTGRTKDAIPLLAKAEGMNAADPLPALSLGRAYSSLGDYAPAIQQFKRALGLDPKQSSAWFDLGLAQLDTVEADARALTGSYADSAYAKALYAESLVSQSRYKEAAALYKAVLAAKDQPPCMGSEAGVADLKQGDTAGAATLFERERSEQPGCTLALLGQARLSLESGHAPQALQLIETAWLRDPAFLDQRTSVLFDGLSPQLFQAFLSYLTPQQAAGGLSPDLYAALTQPPASPSSAQGILSATRPAVNTAAEGHAAYTEGHYAHCAAILTSAMRSRNATELRELATCSYLSGNYSLTAAAGRALQVLPSPNQAEALFWSIRANEKLAFDSLAHFQQLEPNSARSHILLGDIYRQRHRYDDAQKEYSKALDLSPNNTAALLGLASAFYADSDLEKTVVVAHQALAKSPEDPDINLLLGEALSEQHKFTDAEPFLLKALKAKPQMLPHVHALLGEAYAENGKVVEAIRELKLGAESDGDGRIHYRLARLYSRTGDTANAAIQIKEMKAIQQRRREGAVIAVENAHPSSPGDLP